MYITNWSPLKELDQVLGASRILNNRPEDIQLPAVDIIENDDAYRIEADMPACDKETIEVTFDNQVLLIKAKRAVAVEPVSGSFHRSERKQGAYERRFTLPDDIDANGIAAEYIDGVLRVTISKTATIEPQKIEVKVQ